MRASKFPVFLTLAILSAAAALPARAAVSSMEDLSGCKLPNGISIMPIPGSMAATNGDLLKLSSGAMSALAATADGKPLTPAAIVDRLRANKSADLQYLPDGGGTLWAVSGAIGDLGASYLADAAKLKLDPPMEIRATLRSPAPGMHPGITEGHVYLVKTTDDKFALVRVLEKSDAGLVVQYVYQPAGTTEFAIPDGDRPDYHRPGAASGIATTTPATPINPATTTAPTTPPAIAVVPTPPPTRTPPTAPPLANLNPPAPRSYAPMPTPALGPGDINEPGVLRLLNTPSAAAQTPPLVGGNAPAPAPAVLAPGTELSFEAFAQQRDQMIRRRLVIVDSPARSAAEIQRKATAVSELGLLHADEAADLLVREITFLNTATTKNEFSQETLFPCISALKHIGKPATTAALKELKTLDLNATGEALDAAMYRASLIAMVVRAVEGKDLADVLLQQELDKESDARRHLMYEHLLGKN